MFWKILKIFYLKKSNLYFPPPSLIIFISFQFDLDTISISPNLVLDLKFALCVSNMNHLDHI